MSDNAYRSCRLFLSKFDKIYSLNYDLLLYWAMMREEVDDFHFSSDDGFRSPAEHPDADYVAWESFHSANIQFMHGALHLFDAGHELRKYTWVRTNVPLMEQIRAALKDDLLPLFVSEGASSTKFKRICHHAYLHRCLQSFRGIGGSVFIFGHSLATNDEHILRCLESKPSKVKKLFISVHGDPDTPLNKAIIDRGSRMATHRFERRNPLDVEFFDAASAHVWG